MSDSNPNKFLNVVAGIFLMGFIFFVLKELQAILLPLFIALIISFVFLPFYNFLISKKFPSALAIALTILCILLISNIASVFMITSANTFSAEFPRYELKFLNIYEDLIVKLNLSDKEVESINKSLDVKKLLMSGSFTSLITGIFATITGLLGNYVLILFYIIFILSETKGIRERISAAFSKKNEETLIRTIIDIFSGVKSYIAGKTLLSLIQAVIIGIILWTCGVDFVFIWAFLFFLSDFIPNIGSLVVTVLLATFMLLQFESILLPAIVVAVLIVIQNLKGNILEPKIFGERLDLSPLLLLFSLIFWGYIWGIIGMILSVPIMSMIKIIFMNIPATKPYAILMSNNPLTEKKRKKKL
ncbi:MAG: AI-2E family transporter [Ignavibacteria bacterium]